MVEPKPAFADTFVVETGNYGDFIRLERQRVINYCDKQRPGVVVVPHDPLLLLPEEDIPKHWFHIVLRTKSTSSLTLAIRIDNLYLVGFKTTPGGAWWEFGKESDKRLIANSRRLGFSGHYQDIVGDRGLDTVPLGRAEMIAAVDYLAKQYMSEEAAQSSGDSFAQPKVMLAKLVIMMCEGIRFHTVYGTLSKEFDNPGAKISKLDGEQVRNWDKISKAILAWDKADVKVMHDLGIKDKNAAEKVVALVKNEKEKK